MHKFEENTPKIEKMFAHFILQPYHHFLRAYAFYKYPRFGPWPGIFFFFFSWWFEGLARALRGGPESV